MSSRKLTGTVVSNKMQDTVVVAVKRDITHPKYQKRYPKTERYYAHTTDKLEEGSTVEITQVRPMSKLKRYMVTKELGAQQ